MSLEWLGFAGTALVVLAYLPQITHLIRAKCAAGVSLSAYLIWTSSGLLLLVYALTTGDRVFITLQGYQLLALGLIFVLSLKHRGHRCDEHCGTQDGIKASLSSGTTEGEARVTLVQFDSQDLFEILIDGVPIREVTNLEPEAYQPRSTTPLYGAVGRMIHWVDGEIAEGETVDEGLFELNGSTLVLVSSSNGGSREGDRGVSSQHPGQLWLDLFAGVEPQVCDWSKGPVGLADVWTAP